MAVVQAVEQGTTSALGRVLPLPRKPHHADCPTQVYLDRAALLFQWNRERFHDWDYSDRLFWATYGEKVVPSCTCKHRQIASNGHMEALPEREQPAFVLHYQRNVTAPVLAQLRHRIAMCLVTATNDFAFHYQDLGDPVTHEPGIEHALGKNTREVIRKLRAFEEHAAESLRHRHSSSHGTLPSQGRPRRRYSY